MRWLRATLNALRPQKHAAPSPLPQPDPPICVIGDVHGRLDLLDQLLNQISAQPDHATARIIFVGDLVDRGPDSAGVLARVHALHRATPDRVICLMGNHERMLLDFLADPAGCGPRWMAAGGGETLTSFGLSPWQRQTDPTGGFAALAAALRAALSEDVVDWLAGLPLSWEAEGLAVTHAGADPALPMETQSPRRLLWGPARPGRDVPARSDGLWVAQGHVITDAPYAHNGLILVDTGAWRSGQLSAAWLDSQGLSFLQT